MNGRGDLSEPLVGRHLGAARGAFATGSIEASKAAHSIAVPPGGASEEHEETGGRLKVIIFGGLDGILTSFAIVSGSIGANLGPVTILALGISNVVADALSMGAGEFLSSRSYNAYVRKEREREMWELQNYPDGEIAEMVELFVKRGMSREDAAVVIERMAKYKEFFVDIMMTEELSLPVPSDGDPAESFKEAFVMFISFSFFGMLPIFSFFVAEQIVPGLSQASLFAVSCCITVVSLFGLGAHKAQFHDKRYIRSGMQTVLLGSICAFTSYFLGRIVSQFASDSVLFVRWSREV